MYVSNLYALLSPFLIYDVVTRFVIRVTRRVALMEQELPTLLKHRSSYERYIVTLFDKIYVRVAFYSHVESSYMNTYFHFLPPRYQLTAD